MDNVDEHETNGDLFSLFTDILTFTQRVISFYRCNFFFFGFYFNCFIHLLTTLLSVSVHMF